MLRSYGEETFLFAKPNLDHVCASPSFLDDADASVVAAMWHAPVDAWFDLDGYFVTEIVDTQQPAQADLSAGARLLAKQ
jgi:hypothetical protein